MIHEMVDDKRNILLEGAQGTLLDVNHGTYPFVTSSSPSSGGIANGLGLPLTRVSQIIGIFKAYTTRVGEGPFPTELLNGDGEKLRSLGKEFGATTGRARRCGWFDAVMVQRACLISGVSSLCITKLDVLDGFNEVKICTGYKIEGAYIDTIPDMAKLASCCPIYEVLPGWQSTTRGIKTFAALPQAAKDYIYKLETLTGCSVDMISTGPDRVDTIVRTSPYS